MDHKPINKHTEFELNYILDITITVTLKYSLFIGGIHGKGATCTQG